MSPEIPDPSDRQSNADSVFFGGPVPDLSIPSRYAMQVPEPQKPTADKPMIIRRQPNNGAEQPTPAEAIDPPAPSTEVAVPAAVGALLRPPDTPDNLETELDAETLQTYRDSNHILRSKIAALHATSDDPDLSQIEGYIASGGTHHVFILPNGEEVIKVPVFDGVPKPHLNDADPGVIWNEVKSTQQTLTQALARVKGREGFEQIVSPVDIDDAQAGAIVCKYIPGTTLGNMSPEERAQIPQSHFDGFIRTFDVSVELNLLFDDLGASGNIIHHPEGGFTLLDFETADHITVPRHTADLLLDMSRDVLFQGGHGETLPRDAQTFYQSYNQAFGDVEAAKLKHLWQRQEYILPDDL
jgi:hypothetical protein